MNTCKVCKSSNLKIFLKSGKSIYWGCNVCGSKFLDPKNYISNSYEKKHYLKHNNSITDINYKNFLLKLIEPVKDKISISDIGLDYGCGYAPALANVFKSYGFKIELYDPRHRSDDGWDKIEYYTKSRLSLSQNSFSFLQESASADPDPQALGPARLDCDCTFKKANPTVFEGTRCIGVCFSILSIL